MRKLWVIRECNLWIRHEAYLRIRQGVPRHLRDIFSLVQQVVVPSTTD